MIGGKTRVLGVIGCPVEHTSSPAMHNAAIAALGLDYVYVAWRVEEADVGAAVAGMRAMGIAGLNVTVPHKLGVMGHVDEIAPEARAIGAVNTVAWDGERLVGHNTDAYGVMESLRVQGGLETLPAKVALLGAGGASRAVLYGLLQRDEVEEILLLNRTVPRAEALAADLDPQGKKVRCGGLDRVGDVRDCGLLVNSTSIGMHPNEDASPLPDPSALHGDMVVLDIVYNPLKTVLLQQAEEAGATGINGLGMLAYQGARSFEIWTGVKPPAEAMIEAALARLGAA